MTDVTDRIVLAARNNALWCDAVARSHGVVTTTDAAAWTAATRTPPYYPDAVTLSPTVGEYDVLARVDDSDGCSVKDSWSRLDLSMEDFARLVVGDVLERLDAARTELDRAERELDYQRAAEARHGEVPQLEQRLAEEDDEEGTQHPPVSLSE